MAQQYAGSVAERIEDRWLKLITEKNKIILFTSDAAEKKLEVSMTTSETETENKRYPGVFSGKSKN